MLQPGYPAAACWAFKPPSTNEALRGRWGEWHGFVFSFCSLGLWGKKGLLAFCLVSVNMERLLIPCCRLTPSPVLEWSLGGSWGCSLALSPTVAADPLQTSPAFHGAKATIERSIYSDGTLGFAQAGQFFPAVQPCVQH